MNDGTWRVLFAPVSRKTKGKERFLTRAAHAVPRNLTNKRPWGARYCANRKGGPSDQLQLVGLGDACWLDRGRKSPHGTLVHLNFWKSSNHSTSRSAIFTASSTLHPQHSAPSASAADNVQITKRLNTLHGHRSMGAHTARRAGNDAPIRGSRTKK